jgi:uncharacterized integral membrane protein (TIGR00698 family)
MNPQPSSLPLPSTASALPHLPGLLLVGLLAAVSLNAAQWLQQHGLGALTMAVMLGIVAGNLLPPTVLAPLDPGIAFSRQRLLRVGVMLYGFRISFQQIADVGWHGVALAAAMLAATFTFSWLVGTRLLGLDRRTVILVGAGSSICGAAAIMAVQPVVRGKPGEVAVAVATVVLFGTLAMLCCPLLYQLSQNIPALRVSPAAFGLFTGATVHEVAQVIAVGYALGPEVAANAIVAKMIRVMLLVPFLFALSGWQAAQGHVDGHAAAAQHRRAAIPWFALAFIALAGVHSCGLLPQSWVAVLLDVDGFLLAMAMAGLGMQSKLSALRAAGPGALLLGGLNFVFLMVAGFGLLLFMR